MAVPTVLTDLSATAASNSPSGSESVGSSLDDYLRGIQAVLRGNLAHKGSDIASATTTDLGAVVGLQHDITGTTTITGFGTVSAGVWKVLQFDGAVPLLNSSALILPGGANITTAAGDVAIATSEASGNWRVVSYFKAATGAHVNASTDTASGVIELATQAEMETATDVVRAVTPGRAQYHPGACKAWGYVTVAAGTPTLQVNHNITSIADTTTGTITVTIATDFGTTSYPVTTGVELEGTHAKIGTRAAGSFVVFMYDDTPTLTDTYTAFSFACFGDQP
jgi:hypothetical protein